MKYHVGALSLILVSGCFSSLAANSAEKKVVSEPMKAEIEVKFFIDRAAFEQRLQDAGAALATPRRLMRRQVFDFPLALQKPNMGQVGRVRDEGDKITMTLKEYPLPRTIDNVQELEIVVDDFDAAVKILELSGYQSVSYQENYRTSWKLQGSSIEIDEWPGLPVYAEIEAPSTEELKRIAALLGVDEEQFMIVNNLFVLYERYAGIEARKMRTVKRLTFETFDHTKKALAS